MPFPGFFQNLKTFNYSTNPSSEGWKKVATCHVQCRMWNVVCIAWSVASGMLSTSMNVNSVKCEARSVESLKCSARSVSF